MNYYNDCDKKACAWLRELIAAGHLPPGNVDERSILEIRPDELAGYDQVHMFCGIGFWPLALAATVAAIMAARIYLAIEGRTPELTGVRNARPVE